MIPDSYESELLRIEAAYERRATTLPETRYSVQNQGTLCILQQRQRATLALFRKRHLKLHLLKGLDLGCGTGSWLRDLISWGAAPENLYGIDLLPGRIAEAKRLCPSATTLLVGSAHELEFTSGSFDFVIQSTLFSSILDVRMRSRVASEMMRVLKPEGFVLWYDFHVSNPFNPDVRGITAREIQEFFPGCICRLQRITLAPPLARTVAHSPLLYLVLSGIYFLDTHYLGTIERQPSAIHQLTRSDTLL